MAIAEMARAGILSGRETQEITPHLEAMRAWAVEHGLEPTAIKAIPQKPGEPCLRQIFQVTALGLRREHPITPDLHQLTQQETRFMSGQEVMPHTLIDYDMDGVFCNPGQRLNKQNSTFFLDILALARTAEAAHFCCLRTARPLIDWPFGGNGGIPPFPRMSTESQAQFERILKTSGTKVKVACNKLLDKTGVEWIEKIIEGYKRLYVVVVGSCLNDFRQFQHWVEKYKGVNHEFAFVMVGNHRLI